MIVNNMAEVQITRILPSLNRGTTRKKKKTGVSVQRNVFFIITETSVVFLCRMYSVVVSDEAHQSPLDGRPEVRRVGEQSWHVGVSTSAQRFGEDSHLDETLGVWLQRTHHGAAVVLLERKRD